MTTMPEPRLGVGCLTCGVEEELGLRDAGELARRARAFLTRHHECLTRLDLSVCGGAPASLLGAGA